MSTGDARHLDAVNEATLYLTNTFNNHLSAIRGLLEVADREHASAELREALRIIRHAALSVSDLQRTIAPPPPQKASFDPATAVLEAVSVIRPDLHPGATLIARHDDDRPLLFGDRHQIRDALVHLLANARDAISPKGRILVRIEPGQHEHPLPPDVTQGDYAVITVEDDGVGIAADIVHRIHEPFFSTRGRGGLGLASVYQTVKHHGGGIAVDSTPGAGSSFRLFLPTRDQAVQSSADPEITQRGRPASVLVIDDDQAVRRVVRRCLEREGMVVEEAADGETGLDRHRAVATPFDVIVLDIIMPGMSGWDVLRSLRDGGDHTPVILQSGFTGEANRDEVAQAAAFLRKPYDVGDLITAVTEALPADGPG